MAMRGRPWPSGEAPASARTRRGKGRDPGRDARRLAEGLGWLGLGLGVAAVAAPRAIAGVLGVKNTDSTRSILRVVGLREVVSGAGILTQPRPAGWLWSRVAGDLLDLALLLAAMTSPRARRTRVLSATAAVAGVTALDLLASRRLSEGDGAAAGDRPLGAVTVRKTIAINRAADELYRFWRDASNLPRFMSDLESVQVTGDRRSHWKARGPAGVGVEWDAELTEDRPGELIAWRSLAGSPVDHAGTVRFERAPGGRGTLVAVETRYTPPGGALTGTVAWLMGQAPGQQVQENLRRFKQLMETGEITVSEGALGGGARPLERVERATAVARETAR
jgi:uncharacterized membrane protein